MWLATNVPDIMFAVYGSIY